jgi:hypothetical protein
LLKGRCFHTYEEREYVTGTPAQELVRCRGGSGDVELSEEFHLQILVEIRSGSRRRLGRKADGKAAGSTREEDE